MSEEGHGPEGSPRAQEEKHISEEDSVPPTRVAEGLGLAATRQLGKNGTLSAGRRWKW